MKDGGVPDRDKAAGRDRSVARGPALRANDPENTRRNILDVASREFAEKGFTGARVDEIAARTETSKRMIYYYFGDKEGLFVAVLEEAYKSIRAREAELKLDHLSPEDAIRALVGFTFDFQNDNEQFVRIVMTENIHYGAHLGSSRILQDLNVSVIDTIRSIYARGVAEGLFRPGIDEIDLHQTISALCIFNVSNRYTFSRIFKRDLTDPEVRARRRDSVIETVVRSLKA
jgi:AcrR family transcriptional regulator